MKRAVVYCRVSTEDQVKNFSLPTQRRVCEEYCTREELEVARIFMERGVSAKTADRPELQKLLAFCHEHRKQIAEVVVYAVSRLARNTADHLAIRAALAKDDIRLRSVTEQFDESSQGFVETIMSAISQFDNDVRSERTTEGLRAALMAGKWTFQPPVGYRKPTPKIEGSPSLEPDPERAPLVAKAFELMSHADRKRNDVLREVTALGLRSARGKPLRPQSFGDLLKNSLYAGIMRVSKWGIEARGDFEPLISEETFWAVQAVLDGPGMVKAARKRDHPDFPLRRFVRCGGCGKPLTGSWSKGRDKRYGYYRCTRAACRINVRKEELERLFGRALRALQPDLSCFRLFTEIVRDAWQQRQASEQDTLAQLRAREHALQERQDKLVDARLFDETIDQETYDRRFKKLARELAQVRAELEREEAAAPDVEEVVKFAHELFIDPARFWRDLGPEDRPTLQDAIYPSGLAFDGELIGTAATSRAFRYLRPPNAGLKTW